MSVWNLTKYFLISKPFWLLSMRPATGLLSRYTARFILELLSKMAILTGTNYCRCRPKFCFIPSSGSVGCLWSKLVTFASCSLIHGPFNLCVLGVYLFMITVTWSIEARLKTRMFQIKSVPRAILLFLASVLFLRGMNEVFHLQREDFGPTKGS